MRLAVKKTYKLFINGQFPRSESGRVYELKDSKGKFLANPVLGSRKDLRDCVVSSRAAFGGWSSATAYNRGQILYRIAEMMEGRSEQFVAELVSQEGISTSSAKKEVQKAIDLWVWYAGWTDKISALTGSNNPVAAPFYNFSDSEALGVVAVFASGKPSLLNLVAGVAPVIAGGNVAILIANEKYPISAITLAEVLSTSDLPAGVVNVITGKGHELAPWVGSHMDIDGVDATGLSKKLLKELEVAGAENLKRIHTFETTKSPNRITSFMELKTIWHPIGI
jgi:acyl-CoA reductase-like NAD-dependent aldehyde dehydrogenase